MISRRNFIKTTAAAYVATRSNRSFADDKKSCESGKSALIHPDHIKVIPGTNEPLASIGMGTWITFDVPDDQRVLNQRAQVLKRFFELGGEMVDSSPMYGTAESVLGYCLNRIGDDCKLFAASKIWTPLTILGPTQMSNTEDLWGVGQMDLMYVHNMRNWKNHLPKLREWKAEGRIRHLGITTSHGRRHELLEQLIKTEVVDFIQLTYNYDQRATEERLIPLAQDHGAAVIVNRPFQRGYLIDKYQSQPLPGLASELGCKSWPQYLLLYAVSHPGVTAVIPATSREDHMIENMSVMRLPIPDSAVRKLM